MNRLTLLPVLALAASACLGEGDQERTGVPVRTPPVLARVPVFPDSRLVDTVGTPEAARAVLVTEAPPDSVAAFYRSRLVAEGWRIVGDLPEGGGVDLYAQREGPPLWVQVRPGSAEGSTRYVLIGAVRAPDRPPADSSP